MQVALEDGNCCKHSLVKLSIGNEIVKSTSLFCETEKRIGAREFITDKSLENTRVGKRKDDGDTGEGGERLDYATG